MAKKKKEKEKNNNNGLYIFLVVVLGIVGFIFGYESDIYGTVQTYLYDTFGNEIKEVETSLDDVKAYFLDVGEADATLINSNGKYVLIDAGNNLDGNNLVEYMKELGIKKLDYVIGTHAHEDHIGGMDNVIRAFDIGTYYMPKTVVATMSYEDVVKALKEKNLKYSVPKVGTTFTVGKSNFEILHIDSDEEEQNNDSIVIKMTYKNISFLFNGDLPTEKESSILNKDIKADVLKVAHHGSRYSTSYDFLDKVGAKYAVISCGKLNDYNHPHNQLLKRLNKRKLKVYRTDLRGTIIFSTDGDNLNIINEKTNINVEEDKK
jgi:competence protein ComEC